MSAPVGPAGRAVARMKRLDRAVVGRDHQESRVHHNRTCFLYPRCCPLLTSLTRTRRWLGELRLRCLVSYHFPAASPGAPSSHVPAHMCQLMRTSRLQVTLALPNMLITFVACPTVAPAHVTLHCYAGCGCRTHPSQRYGCLDRENHHKAVRALAISPTALKRSRAGSQGPIHIISKTEPLTTWHPSASCTGR